MDETQNNKSEKEKGKEKNLVTSKQQHQMTIFIPILRIVVLLLKNGNQCESVAGIGGECEGE